MKKILLLLAFLLLAPILLYASENYNPYKDIFNKELNEPNILRERDDFINYYSRDKIRTRELPPPEIGRIVGQLLVSPMFGVACAYVGGFIGVSIEAMTTSNHGYLEGMTGFMIGALVGYSLGNGAGITVIGNTDRIKGNFFSATGGTALGTATYLVLLNLIYKNKGINLRNTADYFIIFGGAWLLPTGLGTLSYYLTRKWVDNSGMSDAGINLDMPNLTVKQNPYLLNPAPMLSLNLLTMNF